MPSEHHIGAFHTWVRSLIGWAGALLRQVHEVGEAAGANSPTGITFNRFGGDGIMDLLAALLRRLDAVLVVPGGPTMIQQDADRELLPASLKDEWPVVVAHTGAEIDRAIRGS